ncbi:MAG: 30S ribosomal protein S17 [candidate division Zixibacteria bacterium]|nr:30S ribosomal protein S17 [candidate division Zixibacteria bacterium]
MTETQRGRRKTRVGVVSSDKMNKTITVEFDRVMEHRLYKRVIRRTMKIKAHDENGEARVGDRVRLMETRPLSKTKRWRLVEILERAK